MSKTLLAFYDDAHRWVAQEWTEDLDYFENLTPESIDAWRFFGEYVHVVLVSGFRWSIINGLYDAGLWQALREGDFKAVAQGPVLVRRKALRYFGNQRKIDAIIGMASWLAVDGNWDTMKAALTNRDPLPSLRLLPFIGPITQYHLARNLGLDCAKPDRWLKCIVLKFGYPPTDSGVFEMVDFIAKATGDRPGVIDYVLWRWAEQHPRYFGETDKHAA